MSAVHVDFQNYSLENLIEPQQLIKVARRINYDLGLRIYKTKEVLLELNHGNVKLPDDFSVWNFGLLCGNYTITVALPQGTHIEERSITPYLEQPSTIDSCASPVICSGCNTTPCGCAATSASVFACNQTQDTCSCNCTPCTCSTSLQTACDTAVYNPLEPYGNVCTKPRVFLNCKGDCFELIQIIKTETRTYTQLMPLKMIDNAEGVECGCPNLYMKCADEIWIKDGFLYSNLDCGKIYLNYQGMLEDDDGNLLVPDHEMLNEYYEYGVKQRILENLMFNDEDVVQKLQYVEQKLKIARNVALRIVNTPNWSELKKLHEKNRKAQYNKYYSQFSSYSWFTGYNGFN